MQNKVLSLNAGSIVQVVGFPGAGKSTLLWCTFNQWEGIGVRIFVDAEGSCHSRSCDLSKGYIYRVCSLSALFGCLRQLGELTAARNGPVLLCIDGVGTLLASVEGVSARMRVAATLMQLVNRLCEKNRLLAVVISNCMTARRGPVLGAVFGRFFTERIVL